jgi:DNA-directed RNA polymerase II subunit RPB9
MRHEIASSVGDTAGITQDVGQDPTVGLTRSLSRTTLSDELLPSMCTMCGQEIMCIECGEEAAPGIALETFDVDMPESQAEVDEPASKK